MGILIYIYRESLFFCLDNILPEVYNDDNEF